MSDETQARRQSLAGRYHLDRQPEWRKLLTHFDLSDGFALIVLLVLDADGADLCRHELEKHLESEDKKLIALELATPAALRQLPGHFLETSLSPRDTCLWVAAVEPDYSQAFAEWREAWQFALGQLNAYRNPIREKFPLSLIFVGAPWLQEVMREIAPDLWSVRTLVARIEPLPQIQPDLTTHTTATAPVSGGEIDGGDPLFALNEADKLRRVPGKELALANLLHRAGDGFASLQDWNSADKAYAESLELKNRYNAPVPNLLDTLINLGKARLALGKPQNAIALFDQALQIGRTTSNRLAEATVLGNLGGAYLDSGDTQTAVKLANELLKIAIEIGNRKLESDALAILGNAFLILGGIRKSVAVFEQQLLIAREIKNRDHESGALGNLGRAFASAGDFRKAVTFYEQAIALAHKTRNRMLEGILLSNLGSAHGSLGNLEKAIDCCEQALVMIRHAGNTRIENTILGNLGNAYHLLKNDQKAIEFYEQAITMARRYGYPLRECENLQNLGVVYLELGESGKALALFRPAMEIARKIGYRQLEGQVLWNSASACFALGNRIQAIEHAEAALKVFQAIEDPRAAKVLDHLAKWRGEK